MALIDNLISYWKLDEASGTREDAHSTNDLTDNNTVLAAAGIINDGADFESANTESLSITDAAQSGLAITGDLSISLWTKLESALGADEGRQFISKAVAGQRSYSFLLESFGGNFIDFSVSDDGTANSTAQKTWEPSAGVFYHVAVTYDASAGEVKFYIDGSQLSTTVTGMPTSIFDSTTAFYIGVFGTGTGSPFDGIIDEVGIWNKVLTDAEVTELYNGGAGLAYPLTISSTFRSQIIIM